MSSQKVVAWQGFAELGDQFLIGYALQLYGIVPVQLFLVGHAAELYLKAALLKALPGASPFDFRHYIDKMLVQVQGFDPPLLSSFRLDPAIGERFMKGGLIPLADTVGADYAHFVSHQELYWVSKFLMDMKYLGAAHRELPTTFGVSSMSVNPYWLGFFRELRSYLGWPSPGMHADHVADFLSRESGRAPESSLRFLRDLGA